MSAERPIHQLPPELAEFLRPERFAALLHATNIGTVLLVKAPGRDIESLRGPVPIQLRHELYDHPLAPVLRLVVTLYDRPDAPLALETFVNVGASDQRNDFENLSRRDELNLLFYDEALSLRLAKTLPNLDRPTLAETLRVADRMLGSIPSEQFDFDRAKADVMARTRL